MFPFNAPDESSAISTPGKETMVAAVIDEYTLRV